MKLASASLQRTAVTSARLKGLTQDLGLSGRSSFDLIMLALINVHVDIQYSTVLAILYVSYIPVQIPSNMVCHSASRISYNADSLALGIEQDLAVCRF